MALTMANLSKWTYVTSSLLAFFLAMSAGQKQMFCYYGSDSQYRDYPGKFFPSNIDATLCTHVIFAFVNVEDNMFVPQNWNDLGSGGLYAQTLALKSQNSNIKVLLTVGGWVAGHQPFNIAVSSEAKMIEFAENAVMYLRAAGVDGLDVNWEFPGSRGSPPKDKYRYTKLLQTIYSIFQKEATKSRRERLLLIAAVSAGAYYIERAYESAEIHKYLDFMLLMTYHFHGSWEKRAAHHSTILPSKYDKGINLCQTWAVNYWLGVGVPKSKIILGFTTFGVSYTLEDARNNGLNALIKGVGKGGRYTKRPGILAYYEIWENIQFYGWKRFWIQEQDVPYATMGDQWVGYDDVRSLAIKAETLVNGMNLGGAFVWSLELDDFNGNCGIGRFPLLRAINDVIRPRQGLAQSKTLKDVDYFPGPEIQSTAHQDLDEVTYAK